MKISFLIFIVVATLASCRASVKIEKTEPAVITSTTSIPIEMSMSEPELTVSTGAVIVKSSSAVTVSTNSLAPRSVTNPTTSYSIQSSSLSVSTPIVLKPIVNTVFTAGEKFTFTIRYQFIESGQATLEIEEGPSIKGRPTFKFISTAKSNGFSDVFFKVRDYNESIVDAASLASVRFYQDIQEGHFKIKRTYTFDHATAGYRYIREYKGRTTVQEAQITKAASDVLSCFFYFRSLPLEPGKEYKIPVYSDYRTDMIKVVVGSKLETVKTPAGKFTCIKVQPFMNGDAIFKTKEGRMYIWLTHDQKKMPVMIRSKALIGSFEAVLSNAEFPKN